jgi:hypothetical protein
MTEALGSAESVARVEVPGRTAIYLFEVSRRKWDPVFVVWYRRDDFSGKDQPDVTFESARDTPTAKAFDALGQDVHARVTDRRLSVSVSGTPIFIEPTKRHTGTRSRAEGVSCSDASHRAARRAIKAHVTGEAEIILTH